MTLLSYLINSSLQNIKPLTNIAIPNLASVRYASKKAGTSVRNKPGPSKPKHRGWKVQDGHFVERGTILVTQRKPRFHPGLYVGMGEYGTLYALERGKVIVTCEKINPNMDHVWAKMMYAGREGSTIYKKHFHVIPEPQHNRFVLINTV